MRLVVFLLWVRAGQGSAPIFLDRQATVIVIDVPRSADLLPMPSRQTPSSYERGSDKCDQLPCGNDAGLWIPSASDTYTRHIRLARQTGTTLNLEPFRPPMSARIGPCDVVRTHPSTTAPGACHEFAIDFLTSP